MTTPYLDAERRSAHEAALARAEAANAMLRATRRDRWYPRWHIAAAAGWINDPNGVCFYHDEYHVFFQHHPVDSSWGPMHWGHVSSPDLVHWRRESIALAPSTPEDADGVWSGSCVVGDDGRLYAFYTGQRWRNGVDEAEGNIQVQCLAVSDDGRHFDKLGPVVEVDDRLWHARDPKVWRTGDTWFMIFAVSTLDKRAEVWLYTSDDLLGWTFDRVLYRDPDKSVYMLECPDLFPLGDHWVLLACPMGPRPNGYTGRNGHNNGYVVGDWAPGHDFVPLTGHQVLDWGHNYYAPTTMQTPDGRRLMFGWMGSFVHPIASQVEDGWVGQLAVPRELSLDNDLVLRSVPLTELVRLRSDPVEHGAFVLGLNEDRVVLDDVDAAEIEIEVDLAVTTSDRVGLRLGEAADGSHTFLAWDDLAERVVIDRRLAAHGDRGVRGAPHTGKHLTLRILVDRSSVEVFIDGGRNVVSSLVFPGDGSRRLTLASESGTIAVDALRIWRLGDIGLSA